MKISDLQKYNTRETTHEFELEDPVTGEGLGVFLTILSPGSEKPKRTVSRTMSMQQKAELRGKPLTLEQLEANSVDICLSMLKSWRGLEDDSGDALEFNAENAKEHILCVPSFRDQINAAGVDDANFIKA